MARSEGRFDLPPEKVHDAPSRSPHSYLSHLGSRLFLAPAHELAGTRRSTLFSVIFIFDARARRRTSRLDRIRSIETTADPNARLTAWLRAVRQLAAELDGSDFAPRIQTNLVKALGESMSIGRPTGLRWDEQRMDALHDVVGDARALAATLYRYADAAEERGPGDLNLETMLMKKVEWRARDLHRRHALRHSTRERPLTEAVPRASRARAEHHALICQIADHAARQGDDVYRDVVRLKLTGWSDTDIARELGISRPKVQRRIGRLRAWLAGRESA